MSVHAFRLGGLVVQLSALTEGTVLKPFEGEDTGATDFLLNKAKVYLRERLAVTYLLQTKGETVAYFSLLNDRCIKDSDVPVDWDQTGMLGDGRHVVYPAVKIGRVSISKHHSHLGLGRLIINFIINMYIEVQQRAGCRFITVDAGRESEMLKLYEQLGFRYLTERDAGDRIRTMYLDLYYCC